MQDFAQGGPLNPKVFELQRRLGFRAVAGRGENSSCSVQRAQMIENLLDDLLAAAG